MTRIDIYFSKEGGVAYTPNANIPFIYTHKDTVKPLFMSR